MSGQATAATLSAWIEECGGPQRGRGRVGGGGGVHAQDGGDEEEDDEYADIDWSGAAAAAASSGGPGSCDRGGAVGSTAAAGAGQAEPPASAPAAAPAAGPDVPAAGAKAPEVPTAEVGASLAGSVRARARRRLAGPSRAGAKAGVGGVPVAATAEPPRAGRAKIAAGAVPSSRAAFRGHPKYVLDSQLRVQDVVYPPDAKPAGLFRGQEKVWRRADVAELRTTTQWRREGRVVREDEPAYKVARQGTAFAARLFGLWQTDPAPEAAEPPADGGAEGGGGGVAAIPGVNKFGSVDIPDGKGPPPPGTVYVPDNAARAAAARLGVLHAPVVVGFTRQHGQPKPRYDGIVVWARDAEEVIRATEEEKERVRAAEEQRRKERLGAAWRLLVKNILVDLYVEARYRTGAEGEAEAISASSNAPLEALAGVL